jgi:hypothetical protein
MDEYLIRWRPADDRVSIANDGWREPEPGELSRLATILQQAAVPQLMDWIVVGLGGLLMAVLWAGGVFHG